MILDPMIPGEGGGGTVGYPVPQNGMMKPGRLCLDIIKDRYGKPVLTPIRGAEVAKTECFEVVQRSMMTAAKGRIPRNGMIHIKTNGPK